MRIVTVSFDAGHRLLELEEIERRKQVFRKDQVFPDIKGKTVIIADDGIATGSTIIAAIKMCRKRGAEKIVVAAPVCAKRTANELQQKADEVVALETPEHFNAISQFYGSFRNLTDQEALAFLEQWEKKTV
jgi:putative phosphoribosyl transferase